ncbi:hypothetical protein V6N12_010900 [Hibiscus sabdariffa]|uniref:Reverse transcriptase domain-containing protein n=1 Tax=Hibiscus sabdariffa TaxID=183260 RepID=A0ABR2EN81_9ROSI
MEIISSTIKELKIKACTESREEFLFKCDHPLWKNPEFYIQMPLKKNEDINPTKASHSGMNPDHQKLVKTECNELLQQDLIEPSDSQWSCEAFYINKRSEQARAPSLLQKAMIKIFHPILDKALIYIDDVLLYSPNEESHITLLNQFKQLVLHYGIMLSERKMKIAQQEIEFLGMHLKEGKYHPGPHIAEELLKFPDENLSKKQILQFLGIVNYLRDFLPKISKYTNPLRKMLKKDPPPILKEKLQHLPPLQIPSEGKRILHTDASDKYWGAILFEEKQGRRQLCGYKSDRFSDAKIHYHSTFKEILAVKKGISKFEFHLSGHHFLVEMDMSSFPQMIKFKQKIIPNPQLLRWAEWFSKYSFDCKHIKAKQLGSFPSAYIHKIQWEDVRKRENKYRELQKHMCQINRQIPKEIWPPPEEQAPWDTWPENPSLLIPYHKAIMEAQQQYRDNIPDPSKWSQDYPWYDSSASKINESAVSAEKTRDNHMEMEQENCDSDTSTDSAQLPYSNRN